MAKIATRESYGQALAEIGLKNEKIFVLDADLSKSTKTADFKKVAPERFINAGIAEANMVGIAAGLAAAGKIPFASTFAIFAAGRAFEQIRNSIAYPKLNVKIAATHAGITVGEDGGSHQAIEDIALMRAVPNMMVLVPSDDRQTRAIIKAAVEYNGPMYIRLGRLASDDVYDNNMNFELGKANILREGDDITIIATGYMVHLAVIAARELAGKGMHADVLDIHSIKPLDKEAIIKSAKKTGKVLTIEEHNIIGGLGSAVTEVICEEYPVKVKRMGIEDCFGQSGKPADLLVEYGLTVENIMKQAQSM